MLEILYGVRVVLASDGLRLRVTGPRAVVEAAIPMLTLHREALLVYLRSAAALKGRALRMPSLASTFTS